MHRFRTILRYSHSGANSELSASALKVITTTAPKTMLPNNKLVFGQTFSDHMLTVNWSANEGWAKPVISPYANFSLDPACTVFHYGVECFEGMKAKTGFSAVSLYASTKYVRAWPGGTGDSKLGANYASGIRPQLEVAKDGHQQILWLFGDKFNVTEVGTMNFFMLWTNENGEKELRTPPLDGTILPGVTRDSILSLTKEWNEFKVVEKPITVDEITQAVKENRVIEMFGAGTAAIVSPIKNIHFQGVDYNIPLDPSQPDSQAGPLTKRLADTIMGIQYGEIPHKWSVVIN
ncbi:branched-chain-amino-acid aminotransferase [Globomyces sp. JEL0801]|nr:branched-chain-amino-acid aminotransferase [Globomyces sp. JEL0801]